MRRTWAATGVLAIVMTGLTGQPATARPGPSAERVPGERAVTLVTGDKVLVGNDSMSLRPVPGKGREGMRFALRRQGGHSYVVPSDALPMLASGALDWRLFDVAGLVEAGYDDARRADLPLIVRTHRIGLNATRHLSTLDVQAVKAAKDTAFWTRIRTDPSARVWLDGVRRPLLDRSVPHIGAPAAWAAGYTGTGVTVAVLDSGIDAAHPDLAGKIMDSRDFTDDPAAGGLTLSQAGGGDQVGHGTHVASIIAGTGAASGGRYRGVAPDAGLLDGKVCTLFGCAESWILAGMEWASVEKAATVVNLSLGGADNPGIDPLEEAVNRLTAERGTLFVIATGNVGQCSIRNRVGSPGSAEAALTVGAMDLDDALARFSCQGPAIETSALKPDLTAPGVDIVAARAPGTPVGDADPVDEHYTRLSGTSMATPHVAGAAALLAQEHPDWRADRLKSALMGSALPNAALTEYQQGAGRVDVARAIAQTVTAAPPSLSLGLQRWPHTDDAPIVRTLTYRNDAPENAVLSVRVEVSGPDGQPAPAGMFALSARVVTVPAGGEASVTLTTNTRVPAPDGRYTGRVLANGGGTVVGTPIAVERERESYDITVRALDRRGAPTDLFIGDVYLPDEVAFFQGSATVRLARGEYELGSFVFTEETEPPFGSLALLATHVVLTADLTVVLDSRLGKPVDVAPQRESAVLAAGMVAATGVEDTYSYTIGLFASGSAAYQNLFSAHIGPSSPDPARLSSYVYGAFAEPAPIGDFVDSPYMYNLAWFKPGRVFDGFVRHPRDRDLAAVRSEYPTPGGRLATKLDFARLASIDGMSTIAIQLQFFLPARRTEFFTTDGVEWQSEVNRYGPSGFEASLGSAWRGYHGGSSVERWGVGVLGPALPRPHFGEVWVRQFPDTLVFRVPMFSDAAPAHFGDARTDSAHTSLYRDGELVAESSDPGYVLYQAPAAAANLRVETVATQSVYDTSTEIRAAWRFPTAPVAGPEAALLPAMVVRFLPELDLGNSAPGGRPYAIPVTVVRQPGAPDPRLVSLTVEVSYDDGVTWRRAPVVKTPHGWLAPVVHPAAGFVSLRAKAVDVAGGSVEETIIRAYRLR